MADRFLERTCRVLPHHQYRNPMIPMILRGYWWLKPQFRKVPLKLTQWTQGYNSWNHSWFTSWCPKPKKRKHQFDQLSRGGPRAMVLSKHALQWLWRAWLKSFPWVWFQNLYKPILYWYFFVNSKPLFWSFLWCPYLNVSLFSVGHDFIKGSEAPHRSSPAIEPSHAQALAKEVQEILTIRPFCGIPTIHHDLLQTLLLSRSA